MVPGHRNPPGANPLFFKSAVSADRKVLFPPCTGPVTRNILLSLGFLDIKVSSENTPNLLALYKLKEVIPVRRDLFLINKLVIYILPGLFSVGIQ